MTRLSQVLLATVLLTPQAIAAEPPTAIVVAPIHDARVVRGDDGKDHVEYDLLVTNAFAAPVSLRSVVVTAGGAEHLALGGGDFIP